MSYYSQITPVDLRYINRNIDEAINISDYSEALFIYSADTFAGSLRTALLRQEG